MKYFYLLLFTTGLFTSCNFDSVRPASSGKPGELIVVIDSMTWKSEAGSKMQDSLMMAVPGLPQVEPSLTVVTVPQDKFKNLLQNHRNVLMVETGPVTGNKPYALTMKHDLWSAPQLVLNLRAVNSAELSNAVNAMAATIRERFLEEDRNRFVEKLKLDKKSAVATELDSHLGIQLPLSDDYFTAKKEQDYIWIRKETANSSFGFQVHRFPYTSDSSFTLEAIVALRDSLSKKHVPGPLDGSYMTTDKNFPFTLSTSEIANSYSKTVRGLWRTEGDFMGGPFLAYLILDKANSQLVFIDSYIYAPKFDKREYVRQIDAIVHALTFTKK
ncbi:MAG: DUF4837 family protein [Bacteroidota bacterium]|nr:DUF4837 family protein [Bacteroidota bacterium]